MNAIYPDFFFSKGGVPSSFLASFFGLEPTADLLCFSFTGLIGVDGLAGDCTALTGDFDVFTGIDGLAGGCAVLAGDFDVLSGDFVIFSGDFAASTGFFCGDICVGCLVTKAAWPLG